MRILIDADACPVLEVTEEIAQKYGLDLIIYTDICHQLYSDYGQVVRLDKADQSVDIEIINNCCEGDIVITQDYGLAAVVLGKKAQALNFKGLIYTNKNIDNLLLKRHIHAKIRKAGGRHPTQRKRSGKDDLKFKDALIKLIGEGALNHEQTEGNNS